MRLAALVSFALLAASVVLAPSALVMNITRSQTARDLAWAYRIVDWAPWITSFLAAAGLALAWSIVRRSSSATVTARVLSVVLVLGLGAASWFSLTRPAEAVFAPLTHMSFVAADAVDFLEPDDMVLGVRMGDAARAYPVGQLIYHHIVNDVVAGVPIVATF